MDKQWILSVAKKVGDPYAGLYWEPDMENGGRGLVRIMDEHLRMSFDWFREKSNENIVNQGFSFYYARQVFDDAYGYVSEDPNNSSSEERFLQIGKVFGIQSEPLLVVVNTKYIGGVYRIVSAFATSNPYYLHGYARSKHHKQLAESAYRRRVAAGWTDEVIRSTILKR